MQQAADAAFAQVPVLGISDLPSGQRRPFGGAHGADLDRCRRYLFRHRRRCASDPSGDVARVLRYKRSGVRHCERREYKFGWRVLVCYRMPHIKEKIWEISCIKCFIVYIIFISLRTSAVHYTFKVNIGR